jgi:hypothetical protein
MFVDKVIRIWIANHKTDTYFGWENE